MTQEEKQLLLKDLCARLSYDVIIRCTDNDTDYKCFLTTGILNELLYNMEYYDYKPYLRPMSSMTEEEKKERDFYCGYKPYDENTGESYLTEYDMPDYLDWLLANHFDFHGLIEKGLALEAPKNMYKTE